MSDNHVPPKRLSDIHVVILVNYIRRHHIIAFKELAKKVKRLTILLSTPMEPDRSWTTDWEDLDVRIQKNWMFTTSWRHSTGFKEPNFIHIPIDTKSQLKNLQPDIVFSYELGMRTLLCSSYRRQNPDVPLVMVGNMSDLIERERGFSRRLIRKLLRSRVDYCTYNGPSCKRYLESLGFGERELFHVPYCIDDEKIFAGDKSFSGDGMLRLVYCGAISQRKGIQQFCQRLRQWSNRAGDRKLELTICGSGPLRDAIEQSQTEKFKIKFAGEVGNEGLRTAYRDADICVFPTLADEWGLVPVEALASAVPVLGSRFAQSIEELCVDGINGWTFSPMVPAEMFSAMDCAFHLSTAELQAMSRSARESVAHITPGRTAEKFCNVIESVLKTAPSPRTPLQTQKLNSPVI